MRTFYNRQLLMILSVLLIIVSFSSVAVNSGLRDLLFQKQAEVMLMRPSKQTATEITDPNFALYFPEQITVKKGETFSISLYLLSKEPVEAFAVYFTFDPQILAVKKISPAKSFPRYPELFYDNDKGVVRLVAETDQEFQGDEAVATFQFLAKEAGASQLYFSSNEQGQESHILQKGTNVIEAVGDAQVFVEVFVEEK